MSVGLEVVVCSHRDSECRTHVRFNRPPGKIASIHVPRRRGAISTETLRVPVPEASASARRTRSLVYIVAPNDPSHLEGRPSPSKSQRLEGWYFTSVPCGHSSRVKGSVTLNYATDVAWQEPSGLAG